MALPWICEGHFSYSSPYGESGSSTAIAFHVVVENALGTSYADHLIGNSANNVLNGNLGADVMSGYLGNDTYVVDNLGDSVIENLNEGIDQINVKIATVGGAYALANHVENATLLSAVAYNLTGNDLNNVLIGNAAINVLTGGDGKDTLNGGLGADTLIGGAGNDTYFVDRLGDRVIEDLDAGIDRVNVNIATAGGTYTLGGNIENATLLSLVAYHLTGNDLNNMLIGNAAANTLAGGAGRDILNGGAGADKLIGGAGDDLYYVDSALDIVSETDADPATGGIDEVRSTISYSLMDTDGAGANGGNVEKLTLLGRAVINGTGNKLDNLITGNIAANNLNGGLGADTLIGGLGNDIYVIDDVGDSIVETSTLATEIDTVKSYIDYTLGANLENLRLIGVAVNGTGNARNNLLIGNNLNNLLDGGAGIDTLSGGQGNDTYIVDLVKSRGLAVLQDTVIENANQGNDTLQLRTAGNLGLTTATTLTLAANLENLDAHATGINKLNLTGNSVGNTLTGNDAANVLDGGLGADTLIGGAGNDTYVIDMNSDTVTEDFDEGIDVILVKITGSSLFVQSKGVVDMTTLPNAATFKLSNDVAVMPSFSYTLGENIENARLINFIPFNLIGNDLGNVLTGNAYVNTLAGGAGRDILNGGAGADKLIGGAGDDLYYVDSALDIVSETDADPTTGGIDEVRSTISYSLMDTDGAGANGGNVEKLTLLGKAVINGTGNKLDNLIIGNTATNYLWGHVGDDSLYGLGGNDKIDGGDGNDLLVGGIGNDTLIGGLGADTFWYDAAANATTNKDTIADFVSGTDKLQFSLSVLSALGVFGQFDAIDDRFLSNSTGLAQIDDNRLIYNAETGGLYYDSNGSAAGGSILIELLAHAPTLVATDIWVV